MAKRRNKAAADRYKKAKAEAKKDSGGGSDEPLPVEPGRYHCQIVGAELFTYRPAKSKVDVTKIVARYQVVEDKDNAGKVLANFMNVEDERGLYYACRDLRRLGIEDDEFSNDDELLACFREAVNQQLCVRVTVREKDGYKNMYVDKGVEVDAADLVPLEGDNKSEPEAEPEQENDDSGAEVKVPEGAPKAGDRCKVAIDGEEYDGEIESVDYEAKTADVKFDDGDEDTFPFSEVDVLDA